MITAAHEDVPTGVGRSNTGTYRGSVISFALSAIALGLLGGAPPISILPAIIGVTGGLISSRRLRTTLRDRRGRGMATAAVVIGLSAGALSLITVFTSQPV